MTNFAGLLSLLPLKINMNLSEIIRSDTPLSGFGRFALAVRLAVPAILAQISAVVMGYIDASMVGSLGADAAASIDLWPLPHGSSMGSARLERWVFMFRQPISSAPAGPRQPVQFCVRP